MPSPTYSERTVSRGSVHLDALRGGAAMLVFLNHTRALYFTSTIGEPVRQETIPGKTTTIQDVASPIPSADGGGLRLASGAVIIFFVLSGYLVGGSVIRALGAGSWSWKDYLTRRLTRLWVPLLPCLLLCFVLDHAGLRLFGNGSIYHNPPGIALVTSWHLPERIGVKVLVGNLLFLQYILVPYFGTNNSLWSLANEFWYYLIFPCVALAASRGSVLWRRLVYISLACALLVFIRPELSKLFPIWLMGALVAMLPRPLSSKIASWLSLVALPLLLACMFELRHFRWGELAAQYVLSVATSIFLYLLIQQRQPAPKSVYRSTASFFSLISYTLYIVHLPLAIFLASMVNSPWHLWEKSPRNIALYLLLDCAVLACATLLWKLFEANTDRIRRRIFERVNDPAPVVITRLP